MRRLLGAVSLALGLGAHSAVAQVVQFYLPGDTALTILTNRTAAVDLQVSGTGGVKAYSITLFLDRARVDLIAADTVSGGFGLPQPTRTVGTDSVLLAASGTGSTLFTVTLARLTFHLDTLAQQGSLVSFRVNTLTRGDGTDGLPAHQVGILNLCQALKVGGDVTSDRVVNSRDALVILTAAVGLPVLGFDLRVGDVDFDQQVTSRDALFALSYGIGIGVPASTVVGKALPNACAPLAPAPDSLLFFRGSTLYGVAKGDTVPAPYAPVLAPSFSYPARWSPDGSHILYTAYTGLYYYEIVQANAAGTIVDTLTRNTAYDAGADYSPDGTQIAFVSIRTAPASLWVMNLSRLGTPTQLTSALMTVNTSEPAAWSPDGTRIAFIGYQTCCNYGLWVVNVDSTGLTEVVPGSALQAPGRPEWSAGSDSVYYYRGSTGYIRVAPVVAADTGRPAARLVGNTYYPARSSAGVGFLPTVHYPYDYFLRRASDGRYLRLTRGVASAADAYFSFRRVGVPYVSSVAVSPKPTLPSTVDTVSVLPTAPYAKAKQYAVAVTNSDGSPNTAVPVTWTSSNVGLATVDQTGLVTAVKNDTTTVLIVASVRGWRADTVKVRVVP